MNAFVSLNMNAVKGAHAEFVLCSGRKRRILGVGPDERTLMERLGLKVARLIRISYGPFQLGQLAEGQVEEIPARLWREKLGIGRKKRADQHD